MEEKNGKFSVIISEEKCRNSAGKNTFSRINKEMLKYKLHFFLYIGGEYLLIKTFLFSVQGFRVTYRLLDSVLFLSQFLTHFSIFEYFNSANIFVRVKLNKLLIVPY